MKDKTKKVFVMYVIFCLLQCSTFALKCKSKLSYEEDVKGSLEEAKQSIEEKTCEKDTAVCYSILVDEITIGGELKNNVLNMGCFDAGSALCTTLIVNQSANDLNLQMQGEVAELVKPKVVVKGEKGAEGKCCSYDSCNTDLFEKRWVRKEAEAATEPATEATTEATTEAATEAATEEPVEEKSDGTKVATKLGILYSFAAVFFLARFVQ